MKKCPQCEQDFPDHLIAEFTAITSAGTIKLEVCPICALKLRNKKHGLPSETPFTGGEARRRYKIAQAYLKKKRKSSE
jgi:hypothetical protein